MAGPVGGKAVRKEWEHKGAQDKTVAMLCNMMRRMCSDGVSCTVMRGSNDENVFEKKCCMDDVKPYRNYFCRQ